MVVDHHHHHVPTTMMVNTTDGILTSRPAQSTRSRRMVSWMPCTGVCRASQAAHTQDAPSQVGGMVTPRKRYGAVWDAYKDFEVVARDGRQCVKDRYSGTCFRPGEDQSGRNCRAKQEGDCYNREHSWPKSWWGRGKANMKKDAATDLHHLFPTDEVVNAKRGHLPLGEVAVAHYTSTNGCKVGPCRCPHNGACHNGQCFEPADAIKGELARAYFYMSTRYGDLKGCTDYSPEIIDYVDCFNIRPWMEKTIRIWHDKFPPTQAEKIRNTRVEAWQGNRNPFVDRPEFVGKIPDF